MIRLDKMLAHLGYGTRKEVKTLIRKGYVELNGEVITNDDVKIDPEKDEVIINEQIISYKKYTYIMLNKPQGVITATSDGAQRTVLDLLDDYVGQKLFPVGRLDKDTEGLLLLTNDGPLAHDLLSPKHHVEKEYWAKLKNPLKESDVVSFQKGISLEDGDLCLPAKLLIVAKDEAHIILTEGKYHQIKRMFMMLNNEVVGLKRIRFAHLLLDPSLNPGMSRQLTEGEVFALRQKK